MASAASRFLFSYQKLSKDDHPTTHNQEPLPATVYDSPVVPGAATTPRPYPTRWVRLRRSGSTNRAGWWRTRRPRVRVVGLRRLLSRRVRLLRAAVRKVVRRFKEGRAHFGDLFAGNYMFLQVNPTSATSAAKASAYIQAQRTSSVAAMPGAASDGKLRTMAAPTARYYMPYGLAS